MARGGGRVCSSGFILKLTHLREHWQGVVLRADQRRSLVEGLVKHWHAYGRSVKKLQRFLSDTKKLLPPAGPARCGAQQLQRALQDLQVIHLFILNPVYLFWAVRLSNWRLMRLSVPLL